MITIVNKRVFLDFVRLERAVRRADFDAVQSAVNKIDERAVSLGKRHLVVFAYMYLYFSDGTSRNTHVDIQMKDSGILRSVEYRRAVTSEERLIADWGRIQFEQFGKSFLQAVYASRV